MRTFSEVLREIVNESDLSIYGMAKAVECDRSMLNKVISGDRKINLEMFLNIYGYLRGYVETYKLDELYEAFWEEHLGNKEYRIVKYIKQKYKHMKMEEKEHKNLQKLKLQETEVYKYIKANDIKERAIIDRLYEMMCNVINNNRFVKLYVHVPVYWKEVMNFLKFAFNISEVREHIKLVYIHTGYNKEYDSEFTQIANYLIAYEFSLNGISTYDKNNWCKLEYETELAPYYIISEIEIFFMQKNKCIIDVDKSQDTYESIISTVNQMYNESKRFNNIMANDNYKKFLINSMNDSSQCINISNKLPVKLFCTKEIFNRVIKDECEDKEFLINTLELYYKNIRGNKCDIMVADIEMLNFMNNYSVDEKNFNMKNNDRDTKLEILKNIYKYYVLNKNSIFSIFNNKKCSIPTDLSIAILSGKKICSIGYIDIEGRREKALSIIESVEICNHFTNFYKYITYSTGCLNKAEMMMLLDGIINTYKK